MNVTQHNVVVTGFGLFRGHELNPSWEAIKDNQLKILLENVNIITRQIDVSYQEVDEQVEKLWQEFQPLLMVHVGLAAFEDCIRIEERARHGPYVNDDVRQYAPHKHLRVYENEEEVNSTAPKVNEMTIEGETSDKPRARYTCKPCEFTCSESAIDIDQICDRMNRLYDIGQLRLKTKKSSDAGLYVCEYIYQTSLKINRNCLFIHVPNISEEITLEQIRLSIQQVIETAIVQLLARASAHAKGFVCSTMQTKSS